MQVLNAPFPCQGNSWNSFKGMKTLSQGGVPESDATEPGTIRYSVQEMRKAAKKGVPMTSPSGAYPKHERKGFFRSTAKGANGRTDLTHNKEAATRVNGPTNNTAQVFVLVSSKMIRAQKGSSDGKRRQIHAFIIVARLRGMNQAPNSKKFCGLTDQMEIKRRSAFTNVVKKALIGHGERWNIKSKRCRLRDPSQLLKNKGDGVNDAMIAVSGIEQQRPHSKKVRTDKRIR